VLRGEAILIDRSNPASPRPPDLDRQSCLAAAPRRARVVAAFITGAVLAATVWLVVHPGGKGAAARGPAGGGAAAFFQDQARASAPLRAIDAGAGVAPASSAPRERRRQIIEANGGPTSGRSVCVRLCDGYFFPVAPLTGATDLASHQSACTSACPDAPTALYVQPNGSDRIEDAVSTSGAPYTALPVALRSRTTFDNTCVCHRSPKPGYGVALLRDFTLRKGDAVMTPRGFMVFQGQKHPPFARKDFVALTQAAMPSDDRAALMAMQRASIPHPPAGSKGSRIASGMANLTR
jgi:hypothetical protein